MNHEEEIEKYKKTIKSKEGIIFILIIILFFVGFSGCEDIESACDSAQSECEMACYDECDLFNNPDYDFCNSACESACQLGYDECRTYY